MFGILYKGASGRLKQTRRNGWARNARMVRHWVGMPHLLQSCKRGSGERAGMPTHLAQTDVNEVAGGLLVIGRAYPPTLAASSTPSPPPRHR